MWLLPQPAPLSTKDEKKLQKLSDKLASLQEQLTDDDDTNDPIYQQIEEVSEQIDALQAMRQPASAVYSAASSLVLPVRSNS